MDKQWITKHTGKAAAEGLASLVAVSDSEMWHNKTGLGQP